MKRDVIVLGAGLAGLSAAVELANRGLRVTVLEAGDQAGGRARSWKDEHTGDTLDIGPHILLTEYHNMLRFLRDLGTEQDVLWQQGKFITFVDKPHPVTIRLRKLLPPLHILPSLIKVPQVSFKDLLSNYRLMWKVMRLDKADVLRLDDITAEDYLRQKGVSEQFMDWFWRSACMAIKNIPLEQCSAGSLLSFFRYMAGRNGYQVGFATTGLGDLYVPAALQRIRQNGGEVLLNTRVASIEKSAHAVALEDGTRLEAADIISALPPQTLTELLPSQWLENRYFKDIERFRTSPYICVYLWFDRKLTDEAFWARVWSPDTLTYDSYDLSNIRKGWQSRSSLIASNIIYSKRVRTMGEAEIIEKTLRELEEFLPGVAEAQVTHASIHHIPMAVPASYPGMEQCRPSTTSPVHGFYVAGDWIDTGLPASMESAVRSGYLAAEAVLESLRRPSKIAMPLPKTHGLVRLVGGR